MINKFFTPCLAFVCVMGGLSLLFTASVNVTAVAVLLVLYLLVTAACFYAYKHLRPLKITKAVIAVWSLISSAVSVSIAARLVIGSSVLHNDYYPFVVIMTAVFASVFAISPRKPVKKVTFVCACVCLLLLVLTVLLSLTDTDFSMPTVPPPTLRDFFPVSLFVIFDVFLIFDKSENKTPVPYLIGGAAAFLLMIVTVFASISVLSPQTYYTLNMPLLKLWQSTYITSFINRFEIVSMTALYFITALKAGLVLRPCFENINKALRPFFVILIFVLCALLSFL